MRKHSLPSQALPSGSDTVGARWPHFCAVCIHTNDSGNSDAGIQRRYVEKSQPRRQGCRIARIVEVVKAQLFASNDSGVLL